MNKRPLEKQFGKYVAASMVTMLLTGFYAIIDGFFVGQATGDAGLAAINIAWPITALIMATGVGIGAGGAVLMSMRMGEHNERLAALTRSNTLLSLAGASVLLTLVLKITFPGILKAFGAQAEVYWLAMEYSNIIILGCGLQILGSGLMPLLRNQNKTTQAMVIMICGLIANIILDYLLVMVFRLSLAGAALATITAQGITAVLGLFFVFTDKQNKPQKSDFQADFRLIGKVLLTGISPFGLSLAPSVIIMFNNWQCLVYGGDTAVAAYAVLSYVIAPVQSLLAGIGDGVQPLISFCSGAKQYASQRILRKKALLLAVFTGIVLAVAAVAARNLLPIMFGTSPQAAELIRHALVITAPAFIFMGLVRVSSSYFYACGHQRLSLLLIYADPLLITPAILLTFPLFMGLDGIWATLPAGQLLFSVMLIILFRRHQAELQKKEAKENER